MKSRPELGHAQLKARQREIRDKFSESLGLRVHRALSWLGRAEREDDDLDARFVFLWIAFNAAYANDLPDRSSFSERGLFGIFIQRLVKLDDDRLLYDTVWEEFPRSIRLLIDNRYVFQPFWEYQKGNLVEKDWEADFSRSKSVAHSAMGNMDTARVIMVVLERLYTLRNQVLHGGATWNSSVNRSQMRDAVSILNRLVPAVIQIMMDNSNELWGDASYPVVKV